MLFNRALWAPGAGARPRHLAALHRRQDLARSAVPAAAGRAEVPRQAVHRRDDGSVREGHGRAADPRADQGLGPRPRLAAAELRQLDDGRPVGDHGDRARAASTCARSAAASSSRSSSRRRCGSTIPIRRRSKRWSASWRIPSRGACSTRSICSTRWTSGTWSRRCCCAHDSPAIRARALARRRSGRARRWPIAGCRASSAR